MEKKRISLKEIGLPKLAMIFTAGLLLILLSIPGLFGGSNKKDSKSAGLTAERRPDDRPAADNDLDAYRKRMEEEFESMLRKVKGIGDVEVMITFKASKEEVTLKDGPYTQESLNETDGEGGSRTSSSISREENTVLITNRDGETLPYIVQEREPEVEGVLVIAEGGDNAAIIQDIMEAAEVLFDAPAHKVKVMKMNDGTK
jgi:stage III sporulation protein AG